MTSLWLKETGLWRWADHTDLINAAFFVILLLHTDEPSTNNNTYDVCLQVSWFTSQQVPSSLRQISDQYLKLGHDHFLPCILKFVIRYNESFIYIYICIFLVAQQPLVDHDLIIETSRSHSDTPQSIGLLWTSDQPDGETSTWQHTTLIGDDHAPGWIWIQNPRKQAALDWRLDRAATAIGIHMEVTRA